MTATVGLSHSLPYWMKKRYLFQGRGHQYQSREDPRSLRTDIGKRMFSSRVIRISRALTEELEEEKLPEEAESGNKET